MPNLKDTDFDDLFRRASDKYPLRTDSSDWDRMAAALEKDPTPDESGDLDNPDRRRRRRFFWLFLLLPLGGLGYYAWHQTGHASGPADNTVARTNAAAPQPGGAATPSTPPTASATQPGDAATPPTTGAGSTTTATTPSATATAPSTAVTTPSTAATGSSATGATRSTTAAPTRPANKITSTPTNSATKSATRGLILPEASASHPAGSAGSSLATRTPAHTPPSGKKDRSGRYDRSGNPDLAGDRFAAGNASYPDNNPASTPVTDAFTLKTADVNEQRARIAAAWRLTVDVKAPPKDTSSAIKKASAKQRSSYLYAGILAAPDLSTVKFQSMKGVGTTFGILVGYAFNDKWAIETGAYVDRKRYYTSGEYFNIKKGSLPNGTWLNSADGTCYMWEIPLNVRYNFNPGGKTKWFATAGLSTYLMTREKYTYNYGWGGTWPGNKDSSWNIKTPSQYPFSIINLSAGFEQRLGKVGNLRIEPYVRIPLANMGTGKLPIMSAGVNIGITRRLW